MQKIIFPQKANWTLESVFPVYVT